MERSLRFVFGKLSCRQLLMTMLVLLGLLSSTTSVRAGDVVLPKRDTVFIKGGTPPFHVVSFADSGYLDATRTYQSIKNAFSFEFLRDSFPTTQTAFSFTINFKVTFTSLANVTADSLGSFTFKYDPTKQNASDLRAFKIFNNTNALRMVYQITSFSNFVGITQATLPAYITGIDIIERRTLTFDCNQKAGAVLGSGTIVFGTYFGNVTNADDYDIEWNFYEQESDIYKRVVASGIMDSTTFRFNATRVTTSISPFTLPVLYRAGIVQLRIRAGHYKADGTREYTKWAYNSQIPLGTFGSQVAIVSSPHEPTYNWQSEFTFAEEGKNIAQTKYFDGTLRERQAVTRSVANATTIATQTIYDFNGRPVVKTMPIPTLTDTIRYNAQLAMTDSLTTIVPFTKFKFDLNNTCGASAPAMSSRTLESTYYSPNNRKRTTLQDSLIPNAGGFHYTMTEFTPDATGRIRRQSGVGDSFRLGGGHETRYYYGKPTQEELDRLFGTEVGVASHYQKNMVLDPNAQASVSYVDAHGRTIATAFAGGYAANTSPLPSLAQNISDYNQPTTQDILNNVRKGDSLISSYSFLVPQPGPYKIHYGFLPPQFKPTCVPANVCYNCQYELSIKVTYSCPDFFNGNPIVLQRRTFVSGAKLTDTSCTTLPLLTIDTTMNLTQLGEYIITKSLSVYKPAADSLAINFASQSTCKPTLTSLQTAFENRVDSSGCNYNMCDSCKTLGTQDAFVANYITKLKVDTSYVISATDTSAARSFYNALKTECDLACSAYSECSSLLITLTADMNPGGQYALFKLDSLGNLIDNIPADTTTFSRDVKASIFYNQGNGIYGNGYKTPYSPYLNAAGQLDSVLVNGQYAFPQNLSPRDFISNWKPSWANSLVQYHPEYCYYQNCKSNEPCGAFDSKILDIQTYAAAIAAGVIDTNAMFIGDTCFAAGSRRVAYKDSLIRYLGNLVTDTAACNALSAANVISKVVYDDATIPIGKGASASDNDVAWLLLRNFYISYKYSLRSQWRKDSCDACRAGCLDSTKATCKGGFTCNDTVNVWRYKVKRVFNAAIPGGAVVTEASLVAQSNQAKGYIKNGCDSTCVAIADQWMYKLAGCKLLAADSIAIRAGLIAVCKGGCDSTNTSGASSTAGNVATSLGDKTFQDVINRVLGARTPAHGVCDSCNAALISYPAPYATPVYLGPPNIWRKKDAPCLYQNLTNLEACYTTSSTKANYPNFAAWLGQFSEVPIRQRDVDTLKKYYNPSNTALWLPLQINIPPYLQCFTCKTCDSITNIKTSFNCTDANIVNYWNKFANFANQKLGWILSGAEYYDFITNKCTTTARAGACSSQILLCPRSPNGYAPYDTSSCVSGIKSQADVQAKISYDATTDSLRNVFTVNYKNKCLEVLDSLTLTDTIREYHYTLYYYDQAGTLVKTIPPQGVSVLLPAQLAAVKTARAASTVSVPPHTLPTQYVYNTLGKVTVQKSPDADTAKFWYDRIGRLIVSQDGRQRQLGPRYYSYTRYDYLSRVFEVGEDTSITSMTDVIARDTAAYTAWYTAAFKRYVTNTYYDAARFTLSRPLGTDIQDNLRNRVVSATYRDVWSATDSLYDNATHYSYDVTGNVKTLVQDIKELNAFNQRFKRIDYNYDQLSGKVNAVFYQKDSVDQFTHRYVYDADNRLSLVYTSQQLAYYSPSMSGSSYWNQEAMYTYYKHGPLARMLIGNSLQGVDYAYTLQGWLKGMNADSLSPTNDMGRDGLSVNGRKFQPKDVLGYVIHYYQNDYKPITATLFDKDLTNVSSFAQATPNLYNGNIRAISQHNTQFGAPIGYAYGYDQLHRIASMDAWKASGTQNLWQTTAASADYQERVSYDANGNILKYKRNKDAGITQDSLNYKYNTGTNQLQYITDNVANNVSATDIDNQSPNNYIYDKSGNMVADNSQSMSVSWSPYGKILTNTKAGGASLAFGYNAMQQRVVKRVAQSGDTTRTYYIRDAQGNTMGIYTRHNDSVTWREQYIFGSSRLGLYRADTLVNKGLQTISKLYEGKRNYELTNHLGNILAVINDRKTDSLSATNVKLGYNAVVISATDYFPFGMAIDSRSYTSSLYRYGFNGKENDKESGEQDYGMRMYDPRIAKFLSIDPLANKFPHLTPYQFASNSPIQSIDLDGAEKYNYRLALDQNGKVNGLIFDKEIKEWFGDLINGQVHRLINPSTGILYEFGFKSGQEASDFARGKSIEELNKLSENILVRTEIQASATLAAYELSEAAETITKTTIDANAAQTEPNLTSPVIGKPSKSGSKINNSLKEKSQNEVTIYRTQGGVLPNASKSRIAIDNKGDVSIEGNEMLFVTLDDINHQIYFYNKRGGAETGANIVSFKIPKSLADEIKSEAVIQSRGKSFPNSPQKVDLTKSKGAYGLPAKYIKRIEKEAIKGSGKTQKP